MPDPLEITDLLYRRKADRITSKFNFESCLVNATPRSGWSVMVTIKGVPSEVQGSSPDEVFQSLADRLRSNGLEEFDAADVWCNLNLMWMNDVHDRHHRVRLTNFLPFLEQVTPKAFETSTAIRHQLSEWVDLMWGSLEIALCLDENAYTWLRFSQMVDIAAATLNPQTCQILGSPSMHNSFALRVRALKEDPAYSREAAREWLVDTRRRLSNNGTYEGSPLWVR